MSKHQMFISEGAACEVVSESASTHSFLVSADVGWPCFVRMYLVFALHSFYFIPLSLYTQIVRKTGDTHANHYHLQPGHTASDCARTPMLLIDAGLSLITSSVRQGEL
jgi:hypothetical protein